MSKFTDLYKSKNEDREEKAASNPIADNPILYYMQGHSENEIVNALKDADWSDSEIRELVIQMKRAKQGSK